MRNQLWKKLLIAALVIILPLIAAFGSDLIAHRQLRNLPAAEHIDRTIPLSACTLAGASAADDASDETSDEWSEDEEWAEDEEWSEEEDLDEEGWDDEEAWDEEPAEETAAEEASPDAPAEEPAPAEPEELDIPSGSGALIIPCTGWVEDLTITAGSMFDQAYRVVCTLEDGSAVTRTSRYMSAMGQDTIHIGLRVTELRLSFPESGAAVTSIQVNNTLEHNPARMAFWGLATLAVCLLIVFRKAFGKHPEWVVAIIAATLGIWLCVFLPANTGVTYDDQVHARNAFALSYGPTTSRATLFSDNLGNLTWNVSINENSTHVADTWRDQKLVRAVMDGVKDDGVSKPEVYRWAFTDIGYTPISAGIAVSRLFGASNTSQIIWGRLFNLLAYTVLVCLAIRATKRFRLIFAALALMPGAFFQACCITYDATIIGLCFLGIALAVDAILDRETRLTWQRALAMMICLLLGGIVKTVYMPLMLMVWLLPRSKFDSDRQRWFFKLAATVIMVLAVLAMVRGVTSGTVALQDDRGNSPDTQAQIDFILHQPFTYLGYFFSFIWTYFNIYFVDVYRTSWAYLGSLTGTLNTVSLALLLFCAFTDNAPEDDRPMRWHQRLVLFIIFMMAVGMTFTTMYVAFSSVASPNFDGVQARYMIPVLPLMFMLLQPDGVKNRLRGDIWPTVFGVMNVVILGSMALSLTLNAFWL